MNRHSRSKHSRSRPRPSSDSRATPLAALAAGLILSSTGCGGPAPQANPPQANQTTTSAASEANTADAPSASGSANPTGTTAAPTANPITLFLGGDTPGAIEALVAWSAAPADAREPVLLMDPITEAEFAALGPAHTQRLEVMMEESKVLRQLAGAAVREARSLAPTDPARAAQLLDAVERTGSIHRTSGANKLTIMAGEAIERLAQSRRAELFPEAPGDR